MVVVTAPVRDRAPAGDESGFSLSELLVVIGLLMVVLIAAWAGMYALVKSNEVSTAQGNAAQDFSDPLEEMSIALMQNLTLKTAQPNRIEAWTDRNMDGNPELIAFYASGGKLYYEKWDYNSARTTVLSHYVWVMSDRNKNDSSHELFTYYSKLGAVINMSDPTQAAAAASRTWRVKAKVYVVGPGGDLVSDSRDILFRNRS